MPRLLILTALAGLLAGRAALAGVPAAATASRGLDPAALCGAAIAYAQRGRALPPGLLDAIGLVESGRADVLTGAPAPWPWTIDVEGSGHFYDTEAQAIAAVRQFQQQGARSIDIGCMQVNLLQHPDAFPSLAAAFDPVSNALYAADLLTRLRATTSSWMEAAGLYHSATPALAAAYRARVEAALAGTALPDAAQTPPPMLAMAAPLAPFGSVAGAEFRTLLRPVASPPGEPAQGRVTGRGLAAYRAAPVMRRG